MAKGLKFFYEFSSERGEDFGKLQRINIYVEGFSGTAIELTAGGRPYSFTSNKDVAENYLGGITPTSFTLDAVKTDDFNATSFANEKYGDISFKHLIDGNVVASGIISPFEGYDFDLPSGLSTTSLGAECGLVSLKNSTYNVIGEKTKLITIVNNILGTIPNDSSFGIEVIDNTKCYDADGNLKGLYFDQLIDDTNFLGLSNYDTLKQILKEYHQLVFSDGLWSIRNIAEISSGDSVRKVYSGSTAIISANYTRPTKDVQRLAGGSFGKMFSQQNITVVKSKSNLRNVFTDSEFDSQGGWTFVGLAGALFNIEDGLLKNNGNSTYTDSNLATNFDYVQSSPTPFYPYKGIFADGETLEGLKIKLKAFKGSGIKNLRLQIKAQGGSGYANFLNSDGTWYTQDGFNGGTPIYELTYSDGQEVVIDIPTPPYTPPNWLGPIDNLFPIGYFNNLLPNSEVPPSDIEYNLTIRVFLPERNSVDNPSSLNTDANIEYIRVERFNENSALVEGYEKNYGVDIQADRKSNLVVNVGIGENTYPLGLDVLYASDGTPITRYARYGSTTLFNIDEYISRAYLSVLSNRLTFYEGSVLGKVAFTDLLLIDSAKFRVHNLSYNSRTNTSTLKVVELFSSTNGIVVDEENTTIENSDLYKKIFDDITRSLEVQKLTFNDPNIQKTIGVNGQNLISLKPDVRHNSVQAKEVYLKAVGDGIITDVAESTSSDFTLIKPAKNGTYAVVSDIEEMSWLLTANALTAKGYLGSTNAFDVGFKRNNVEYFTLNTDGISVLKDITSSGNLTLQKGNPRLRLRDTSAGGHTGGFDLHVNGDDFIIDDNTHSRNILRNYLNSSIHTTDFDAEVFGFKNGLTTYATLNSVGLTLGTIQAETTDTDRFLVSNNGQVKFRTGVQLLSDIGGFASPTGLTTDYITKWDGTKLVNSNLVSDSGGVHLYKSGTLLVTLNSDFDTNIFLGKDSGLANTPLSATEGRQNTFIGGSSGRNNTIGYAQTFLGFASGFSNTVGNGNTNLGYQTNYRNISGNYNLMVGTDAGFRNKANYNIFIGYHNGFNASLATDITGIHNTSVGSETSLTLSTGYDNSYMGFQSLYGLTSGYKNTALGKNTGFGLSTGYQNLILANEAAENISTGYNNVIAGYRAGYNLASSFNNVGLGTFSLFSLNVGNQNTAVGYNAGFQVTSGSNNLFLGFNSGGAVSQSATASNSIAIGEGSFTTKSNQAVLGSINITETILRGRVGIGTTTVPDILTINTGGSGVGVRVVGYQPENFINLNNQLSENNRTFRLIAGISSVGYNGFSIFDTQANSTRFVIDNNGNVGIGTTTPNSRLDVNGNIGFTQNIGSTRYLLISGATNTYTGSLILQSGAGSDAFGGAINLYGHSHATKPGWVSVGISSGAGTVGTANEGRFTINTTGLANGTDLFTVLRGTGNVGIGTTSPQQRQHNNISSTGIGVGLMLSNDATNATIGRGVGILFAGAGNLNLAQISGQTITSSNNTGGLIFSTSNGGTLAERARITHTGLFGINNTNPNDTLDVNGTGHFTGAVLFDTVPSTPVAPTLGNHLINLNYLNSVTFLKRGESVRTISLTNITLSGTQTVSGVALTVGNLILVAGQTTQSQNGVYVVASGSWTRSTLADSDAELRGAYHYISEGAFANQRYINTNTSTITVGTTAITYALDFGAEVDPIFTAFRDLSRSANLVYASGNGSGSGIGTWRSLVQADIPALDFVTKISNKPTTISGYGITDYNSLWDTQLATKTTTNLTEGGNLYYTQSRFDTAFGLKTTTDLAEGTNLYYTNERGIGSVLTGYTSGAGTISATDTVLQAIQKLNGNVGAITLSSLGGISLTSLTATSPLLYDNATGAFSITRSSSIANGFLHADDWNFFNEKQGRISNYLNYDDSIDNLVLVTDNSSFSWKALNKTLVGLANVENISLSTWTGSTNIATLGTVNTGTWNATTIGINKGGTGLTTLGTANQLIRVNAGATALEYFTPTFLTGNQTITLGGDVSGSGTTSITATLATITQANTGNFRKITLDTKGRVTGNTAVVIGDLTALGAITLGSLSSTATGLTYTNTTGVFSLTSGYSIPLNTSQTNWNMAFGWGNHASAGYLTTSIASTTYQPLLTGLTTNRVTKWSGTTLVDSLISDIGTRVNIGTVPTSRAFDGLLNVYGGVISNTLFLNNTSSLFPAPPQGLSTKLFLTNGDAYINGRFFASNFKHYFGFTSIPSEISTESWSTVTARFASTISIESVKGLIYASGAGVIKAVSGDGYIKNLSNGSFTVSTDIDPTSVSTALLSVGTDSPLTIYQTQSTQDAVTGYYNEVTSAGKWLRINTDSGFSLRHNEIDAISFDNDSWKFNTTFKVVQGEEINDWTGFNIDDRFRLGINDNTGLATFEMVYENSIVRNFFNEEGILSHIDTSGSVRKYLREGDIIGGGTNIIPNLQEVTAQGANSTIRMQFNGVNYATINDISSSQGIQGVLSISKIAQSGIYFNTGSGGSFYENGLLFRDSLGNVEANIAIAAGASGLRPLSISSDYMDITTSNGYLRLGTGNTLDSQTYIGKDNSTDYIVINGQKYNFKLPSKSAGAKYLFNLVDFGTSTERIDIQKINTFVSGGQTYLVL